MEALKVRSPMDSWNDDRIDELARGVKGDFLRVEGQMKEGFAAVDKRFEEVDARFDKVEGEMKAGFAKVDQRFDKVDARFEKVEGEMKAGFEKAGQQLERATQSLGEQMNEGFASVKMQAEARMDRIEGRRAKFQGGIWGILGAAIGSVVTAVVTHFT
ncbi:MAG: hypothetical protein ACTHNP_12680 [Solirubrobacterales bacterium]